MSLLTYRRNRKSEQIRIARDLTDRIESKRHQLWLVDNEAKSLTDQSIKSEIFRNWLWNIGGTLHELEYLTHLVNEGEIKDKFLINLHSPEIIKVLDLEKRTCDKFGLRLENNTNLTEDTRKEFREISNRYESLINELYEKWKRGNTTR